MYKKTFEWIEGDKYAKTYKLEEPFDVIQVLEEIKNSEFSILSIELREDADIGLKTFEGSYSLEEFYQRYNSINKTDIESISIDLEPKCRLYMSQQQYITIFSDIDMELSTIIKGGPRNTF